MHGPPSASHTGRRRPSPTSLAFLTPKRPQVKIFTVLEYWVKRGLWARCTREAATVGPHTVDVGDMGQDQDLWVSFPPPKKKKKNSIYRIYSDHKRAPLPPKTLVINLKKK